MTDIPRLVGRLLAHECSDPSECSEHEAAAALSEQQERLKVAVEALQSTYDELNGLAADGRRTHWEGCEATHASCAVLKRIREALAKIEQSGWKP